MIMIFDTGNNNNNYYYKHNILIRHEIGQRGVISCIFWICYFQNISYRSI